MLAGKKFAFLYSFQSWWGEEPADNPNAQTELKLKRNFDAAKIELKKGRTMKTRAKIGNSCEERKTVKSPAGEYECGYHIED